MKKVQICLYVKDKRKTPEENFLDFSLKIFIILQIFVNKIGERDIFLGFKLDCLEEIELDLVFFFPTKTGSSLETGEKEVLVEKDMMFCQLFQRD